MEVGLYGNIFSNNYDKLQGLATDNTWFKTFWKYVKDSQIEVCLHKEHHVKPIREGYRSLMESFILAGYLDKHMVRLNWVQKHKILLHLSDIIKCDGISVKDGFLVDAVGVSRKHIFPLEQPTRADFTLWDEAVRDISSAGLIISTRLGRYLRRGHSHSHWFLLEDKTRLIFLDPLDDIEGKYDAYEKRGSRYKTCHGKIYIYN